MLPIIRKKGGFTLIELLVVIAILSVLLVIVLVAINPARQTREARNTQRRADVLTVLNAVNQYFVANGSFPTGTPATTGSAENIDSTLAGFCSDLVPTYVAALPYDPSAAGASYTDCGSYDTKYTITLNAGDRITIAAPNAEGGVTIQATR
ncbi:MAG: hypothetical protein A2113_00685 [Candidatus Woykebacteria bacterium GWA1_44_8]|uniref:Type II secretion system protein GspG C-terminal domain-containing protein n=1 Tax=Candidatus Woykebacteria bacterium GWA1_44_8 TaxID=1802591 RepID=A0A1G1W2L3_9BACT|nr:MAG: hypothetical protein A2113_00685 [Candidatus Woykebacteria bacterium GWA1_44_8]